MRKNTGYALYESDENILIGIINCPNEDDSKKVDITQKVKLMIEEHFTADSVKLHSLSSTMLEPNMTVNFGASIEENGEDSERKFELWTVAVY